MPVSAAVGVGVLGAGASVASSKSQSKAIDRSTEAATESNELAVRAQQEARRENVALQQPIYNAGLPAMEARNALLGLGGSQPQGFAAQPNALSPYGTAGTAGLPYGIGDGFVSPGPFNHQGNALAQLGGSGVWDNYLTDNPDVLQGWQETGQAFATPQQYAQFHYNTYGRNEGRALPGQNALAAPGQTAQDAQNAAFENFRNSTGYQFRLNEGLDAVNSGFAGAGLYQSGARDKAILEYSQGLASGEFGNFMGYLGEQQNLAPGAANALSGVNSTYANNTGQLAIANGNLQSANALARAQNSNSLLNGLTGAVGAGVGILQGAGKL